MSNFLWFNKQILIEKSPSFFFFLDEGLNFVYQLFDNNGSIKSCGSSKEEFDFNNILNFKWQQIMYALLLFWKKNDKRNR